MGELRQGTRDGFTLIELSIVLVIIGLIVGGVLVGQDLIKAAQLRAVLTEIDKFNTAANTFLGKYDCLPGDCTNIAATLADHIQGGYPYDKSGHSIFNGNGNGTIDGFNESTYCATAPGANNNGYTNIMEIWGFWHHLALSGMIPSAGTSPGVGVCGPSSCTDSLVGTNIPVSALGGSTGYTVSAAFPGNEYGGDLYSGATGNVFILGTQDNVNNSNIDVCQYSGHWLPALTTTR
jgi:prepilin-type N-terminal cleavage/methylation domain-containing protein